MNDVPEGPLPQVEDSELLIFDPVEDDEDDTWETIADELDEQRGQLAQPLPQSPAADDVVTGAVGVADEDEAAHV